MAKTLASLSALVPPPPPPPLVKLLPNDPNQKSGHGTQSLSSSDWRLKKNDRRLKKTKQAGRRAARRERRHRRKEGLPANEGGDESEDGGVGMEAASPVQHERREEGKKIYSDDDTRELEATSGKINEIDAVSEAAVDNADAVELTNVSVSCTSESSDGEELLELERYTPLKPRERWHPVWGPDARGKLGGPRETHLVVDPETGKQTLTPEALEQDRMKVRHPGESCPALLYFFISFLPSSFLSCTVFSFTLFLPLAMSRFGLALLRPCSKCPRYVGRASVRSQSRT